LEGGGRVGEQVLRFRRRKGTNSIMPKIGGEGRKSRDYTVESRGHHCSGNAVGPDGNGRENGIRPA